MRVLLAGDPALSAPLVRILQADGFRCDLDPSVAEAPATVEIAGSHDAVVFLVRQSGAELHEAIRGMRRRQLDVAVMVIAQGMTAAEEEAVLHHGADDVIAAAAPRELVLARLKTVVRRACRQASPRIACGNVVLDQNRQSVEVGGRRVHMSPKEFEVLEMLMLRQGIVMSKEQIMMRLYGDADGPLDRIVDVFICKLRRKLALAGAVRILQTSWGRGYFAENPGRDAGEAIAAAASLRPARPRAATRPLEHAAA